MYACTHFSLLDDWRGGPFCNSDDYSFFTLSLGPLEAEIHVFSDGLSENDKKSIDERDHKFYCTPVIFECAVNFFFPTWKGVLGAYPDRFFFTFRTQEHPERGVLLDKRGRKRVKE